MTQGRYGEKKDQRRKGKEARFLQDSKGAGCLKSVQREGSQEGKNNQPIGRAEIKD